MSGGPLAGARVLVPRAPAQAPALSERIRALGGEPLEAAVIGIAAGDRPALRRAVRELAEGRFVLVGLTSPNGVDALAGALADESLDARALAGADGVACIGPGTSQRLWERLRIVPDLVGTRATTQGLADAVPAGTGRVLLPRADIATPVLTRRLRDKGYEPVDVVAYRTTRPASLPAPVVDDLAHGRVDLLAFGSSSTARNFVALMDGLAWRGRVVSIGPVTTRTCRELGVEVACEALAHDLDGLVDALVRAHRAG